MPKGRKQDGAGPAKGGRTGKAGPSSDSSAIIGVAVYAVIAIVILAASPSLRRWVLANWVPIGAVVVLVIIVMFWIFARRGGGSWGVVVVALVGIPLVAGLVAVLISVDVRFHQALLRGVFLVIVVFLPAMLYYLFVALRRVSLLQEFVTNLGRLGLLAPRRTIEGGTESERDRQIRVLTYLQMFEGIYGTIPPALSRQIVETTSGSATADDGEVPKFEEYQASLITPEAIPVVVATLLIALGWLLILPPWEFPPKLDLDIVLQPTRAAPLFAFLGAYFFALQMLFRRFVRRDLRANAFVAISLRIILAVVGVWAVLEVARFPGAVFAPEAGGGSSAALLVIAFVVGAFPPIAWQVVVAFFRWATRAPVLVPSLQAQMPLRDLDGLTIWHEGRLEEEDIENIHNMATANLVELILNTRFPPNRVIDWVDQAMLYTQLGGAADEKGEDGKRSAHKVNPAIESLRRYGIRTASSLIAAYSAAQARKQQAGFEKILPAEGGGSRIPSLVDALMTNPNLALVQRWNATADDGAAARPLEVRGPATADAP